MALATGRVAPGIKPRVSIQNATPYVIHVSTVRAHAVRTAGRWRGSSPLPSPTSRLSHAAVGRHTRTAMVATAASPARARRAGGALWGVAAATTATAVPTDTAWMTTADAAAGPRWTPARSARTTNPATLHTFPGTYRPRLARLHARAAARMGSRWPQPARMRRHDSICIR